MRPVVGPRLVWLLAISSLLATAMPFSTTEPGGDVDVDVDAGGPPRDVSRAVACSRDAIDRCRDNTGLDFPACFASTCAPAVEAGTRPKREEDLCTEYNLVQCAIVEWRQAETCFQELCL